MSENSNIDRPRFATAYSDAMEELADFVEILWKEHETSFVKAGNTRVYAFGGNGYVLVMDQQRWNGVVEFITPQLVISIKPDEKGKVTPSAEGIDHPALSKTITEATRELKRYYEDRYWKSGA